MKTGKLSPQQLQDLVLSQLGQRRDDVLVPAKLGEDCAVIDFGEEVCAVTTDPITGAGKGLGRIAVNVACNDLAAMGAQPVGVQIALLLPEGVKENAIKEIMKDIDDEAARLGLQIIGGHTEITNAVKQNIVVATALGKAKKDQFVTSGGARIGDSIILTKGVGLEGAGIIANDYPALLKEVGIGKDILAGARNFLNNLSVVKEGLIAAEKGATAMHDITEGGLLGAAYEMAQGAQKGFKIYAEKIFIPEEVKEICRALQLDPFSLISSGAMLITIRDPEPLVRALEKEKIGAFLIGEVQGKESEIIFPSGKQMKITSAPRDELWKFIDKRNKEGVIG